MAGPGDEVMRHEFTTWIELNCSEGLHDAPLPATLDTPFIVNGAGTPWNCGGQHLVQHS